MANNCNFDDGEGLDSFAYVVVKETVESLNGDMGLSREDNVSNIDRVSLRDSCETPYNITQAEQNSSQLAGNYEAEELQDEVKDAELTDSVESKMTHINDSVYNAIKVNDKNDKKSKYQ